MGNCITDCLKKFLDDLGYFAVLAIVACILLSLATGPLALPAVVACLVAAGIAYGAVAIFGCIGACLIDA